MQGALLQQPEAKLVWTANLQDRSASSRASRRKALSAKCDGGDNDACEVLSAEDDVKRSWVRKVDLTGWRQGSDTVSLVVPLPDETSFKRDVQLTVSSDDLALRVTNPGGRAIVLSVQGVVSLALSTRFYAAHEIRLPWTPTLLVDAPLLLTAIGCFVPLGVEVYEAAH